MEGTKDDDEKGRESLIRGVSKCVLTKVYSRRVRFAPRPLVFLSVGRPIIVFFPLSPSLSSLSFFSRDSLPRLSGLSEISV